LQWDIESSFERAINPRTQIELMEVKTWLAP
jgi:hypothetical protein